MNCFIRDSKIIKYIFILQKLEYELSDIVCILRL